MKKALILVMVFLLGFAAVAYTADFDAALKEKKTFLHTEFKNVSNIDLLMGDDLWDVDMLMEVFLPSSGSTPLSFNPRNGDQEDNGMPLALLVAGSLDRVGFGVDLNMDNYNCRGCIEADITSLTAQAEMHSRASGIPMAAFAPGNGTISNYAHGNEITFSKILKPFYREILERYVGSSSSRNLREYEIGAYGDLGGLLGLLSGGNFNFLEYSALTKSLVENENEHNNSKTDITNKADKIWSATVDGGKAAFVSSFWEEESEDE